MPDIPTLSQAGIHPFVIEKGATFDPFVHWATELGIGIDVSAVTDIRMQIRKTKTSAAKLLELTLGNSRIDRGNVSSKILNVLVNNNAPLASITAAGVITLDAPIFEEFGFVTAGVQANDILSCLGTASNDGDGFGHLVVSVESETQATVVPTSRAGGTSPFALVEETGGAGACLVARDGRFQLLLTPAETAALTWQVGYYDIELEDTNGKVVRLLEGTVTVSEEVTK